MMPQSASRRSKEAACAASQTEVGEVAQAEVQLLQLLTPLAFGLRRLGGEGGNGDQNQRGGQQSWAHGAEDTLNL
jgi:hypothetical protein